MFSFRISFVTLAIGYIDLFPKFYAIPFILEASLFLISLNYLILCCLSKQSWWRVNVVFTATKWIYYFLIFLTLQSIVFVSFPVFDQILVFNGRLVTDFISIFSKVLILFSATFSFYWYRDFIVRNFSKWDSIVELPFIFLGVVLFLLIGVTAYDIGIAVLCIISMSICLYALLIANSVFGRIYREAAIKYFLMSALSGGLTLGGIKEIFVLFGTLNFANVNNSILIELTNQHTLFILPFKVGVILLLFGFLFKISAAPCHFWAPEVYEGTPFSLIILILLPIKIAVSIILFRLLKAVFYVFAYDPWTNDALYTGLESVILCVIAASMLFGAINSVFEQKIKRFIAYSSVNQIGFLIIGLLGSTTTLAGVQSFIYFLVTYVLNMWLFLSILLYMLRFSFSAFNGEKGAVSFQRTLLFISDFRRYNFNKNVGGWIALTLIITIFSLIGIPPLAGFFGKFYLLLYAFSINQWGILALGIITSIISAYYYLRILRAAFFDEKLISTQLTSSSYLDYFYWITISVVGLLFFCFDPLLTDLCHKNAQSLYCLIF